MKLSYEVFKKLVEITKQQKPNEASAFLFKDNTIVVGTGKDKMVNSVGHFTITDYDWVAKLLYQYGVPSAIFHSHPCPAYPSGTDLNFMKITIPIWGCKWLIMSDEYILRCWKWKSCCGLSEEEVIIDDGI